MFRILIAVLFLGCSILPAQELKNFVLASGRGGGVEIIDPATLETVGRIRFDLPPDSAGLNGVSASADGASLYVEGPIADSPNGCCFLYSLDLATMRTRQAAGIWGSHSREAFVITDGVVYRPAELFAHGAMRGLQGSQLHLSPDRHWLFALTSFRGPTLDVYDLAAGARVRRLAPTGLEGDWWPSGTWSGDRFYLYAAKTDGSTAQLWAVPADTLQLGPAVSVQPFGQVSGCSSHRLEEITAAGGNLFVYEAFGFKGDRRDECPTEIPGGAWVVDPATGHLLRHVAADLHFSQLIPDRTDAALYGLALQDRNWQGPSELVRIDARDGRVLRSRGLNPDVWRIATAPLGATPTGNVGALP